MFEGIRGLHFSSTDGSTQHEGALLQTIEGDGGERVDLYESVEIVAQPEVWLRQFDTQIKRALYVLTAKTVEDYYAKSVKGSPAGTLSWIESWPGQCIIVTLHINFTHRIEKIFKAMNQNIEHRKEEDTLEGLKYDLLTEI